MQSKWLFFSIALISLTLGVLPEFISDKMKDRIQGIFGDYYDIIWLIFFFSASVLFIYLTWKQEKSAQVQDSFNKNSTLSPRPTKTGKNKITQKHSGKGDNVAGDKIIRK